MPYDWRSLLGADSDNRALGWKQLPPFLRLPRPALARLPVAVGIAPR